MIRNTLPQSLADNPRLDRWIGFEPDRRVRVSTGKVELGQGAPTGLVQIAAEELDVGPERLRLVSGDTDATPNEGYTAGSRSIEHSGGALRLVCAEIRALFLDAASERLGCPVRELSVEDGRFMRAGHDTGLDYWALADAVDLGRDAAGNAPAKRPADYRVVGRSLPRLDLPAKVFGAAFVHDIAPEDVIHARVLHRPWPRARLASLDDAAVRRAAKHAVELFREGDFVAVLSESESAAVAAIEAAAHRAVWEGGTPLDARCGEARWLTTQPAEGRVIEHAGTRGGPAVRRLEATYTRPYLAHASIGPSCALARFDGGRLTVWTHSQGVYPLRRALAQALGLDEAAISVRHRQGAGCYGHNGADDVALDAALIARQRPGRTVRVQWTRAQELATSPKGAAQLIRLRAGLDAEARPVDWQMEIWSPPHAQRPTMGGRINLLAAEELPDPPAQPEPKDVPDAAGGGAARNAVALYDFAQRIACRFVPRIPIRTSSLRSLGGFANVFAIESFMDELAAAAGRDPVAYRLAHLRDPRARDVVEAAADLADWSDAREAGTGRGRGFAFARYKNTGAFFAIAVEVDVQEQVRLRRAWCAVDAGLVVNPDGVKNQIEGGILQAASWTLKEQVRIEDGRVAGTDWDSYPILVFSEVPEIDIRLLDRPEAPPLGAGEAAQGPTAAATANAVAQALGVRLRDLPLTRERIVAAMLGSAG